MAVQEPVPDVMPEAMTDTHNVSCAPHDGASAAGLAAAAVPFAMALTSIASLSFAPGIDSKIIDAWPVGVACVTVNVPVSVPSEIFVAMPTHIVEPDVVIRSARSVKLASQDEKIAPVEPADW